MKERERERGIRTRGEARWWKREAREENNGGPCLGIEIFGSETEVDGELDGSRSMISPFPVPPPASAGATRVAHGCVVARGAARRLAPRVRAPPHLHIITISIWRHVNTGVVALAV